MSLPRTHTHLMQERNRHINRIHKILETANSKLSSVVTDILGKSARQMLEALIAGESDPAFAGQAGPWSDATEDSSTATGEASALRTPSLLSAKTRPLPISIFSNSASVNWSGK